MYSHIQKATIKSTKHIFFLNMARH